MATKKELEKKTKKLERKVKKLEVQIDTMKCCDNCKSPSYMGNCKFEGDCGDFDKWKLKI